MATSARRGLNVFLDEQDLLWYMIINNALLAS